MTNGQLESYCEAEFENIEKVLSQLRAVVRDKKEFSVPDLAAIATFLYNAYNGMENILKRVLICEGEQIKNSPAWHKELLRTCVEKGVIADDLYELMAGLLSFRHFFVHSYVFVLKWENLQPLVEEVFPAYGTFQSSIKRRIKLI